MVFIATMHEYEAGFDKNKFGNAVLFICGKEYIV